MKQHYRVNPHFTVESTNSGTAFNLIKERLRQESLQVTGWPIPDWAELSSKTQCSHGLNNSMFAACFKNNGALQPFGPLPDGHRLDVAYAVVNTTKKPSPEEEEEDSWDTQDPPKRGDHPILDRMGVLDHGQSILFVAVPPLSNFAGKAGFQAFCYRGTSPLSLRVSQALAEHVARTKGALIWWHPLLLNATWHLAQNVVELVKRARAAKFEMYRKTTEAEPEPVSS